MRDAEYSLRPTFFGGSYVEGQFEIRIQHGSDFEAASDGIVVLVRDAVDVRKHHLMEALAPGTGEDVPVEMTLYLNETCPGGRADAPVAYAARGGSITFEHIYAPDYNENEVETSAVFDAHFEDPSHADTRFADLAGDFRFLYTRGRPAQRFP